MTKILLIALGGAAGSVSRYSLGLWIDKATGSPYSYGTLAANLLGCLLFGVVAGLLERGDVLPKHADVLLLTGFMGAFTTFSTFAFHNMMFAHEGKVGYLLFNVLAQNLLGFAAVFAGFLAARPH
ncbi:MAG: fluoride efflux transporter CrcB [Candidatus Hydrogenedens sp.]|nr:fluoride efflux transporter CrcB [Candidatus Hydrogenedens sp.]